MTDEDVVTYEVRDSMARVTLNRPDYRNAQNSKMTYALDAAFTRAVDDDDVKVIVLAGNGKHFCAGHDIGTPGRDVDQTFRRARPSSGGTTPTRRARTCASPASPRSTSGMCRRWREIPKPMIAMVHGACIAGGLMLAWSCDFIVASDDAFFSDPVVRMGIPGVEYFAHPWVMNPRAAKEFLFTGDRFTAAARHELGMVNQVVPRDELEDAPCSRWPSASRTMPRFGLALTKKAVNQAEDLQGMRSRDGLGLRAAPRRATPTTPRSAPTRSAGMDAGAWRDSTRPAEDGSEPRPHPTPSGVPRTRRGPGSPSTSRRRRSPRWTPRTGFAAHREWEAQLADARWSVVSWPHEYGGRGRLAGRVGDLRGGVLPRRRARPGQPERHLPAGADPVRARHAGAAGAVPALDGHRRDRSGRRPGPSPRPAATSPRSAHGGARRRARRLAAQRAEDVELAGVVRRLGVRAVPHRPRGASGTGGSPTSCSRSTPRA